MQQGDLNKKLGDAVDAGNLPDVKRLLAAGAEVNGVHCEDGCRQTPLVKAVLKGNAMAIAFLLESGANVEIPDKEGKTPLELAYASKKQEIINILEARIEAQNKNPDKIFFYDQLSDRIRQDIYDFNARERVTLIRQSKYGAVETITLTGFSALEDQSDTSVLRKAFNEHRARGGTTDESLIFPNRISKPIFPKRREQ